MLWPKLDTFDRALEDEKRNEIMFWWVQARIAEPLPGSISVSDRYSIVSYCTISVYEPVLMKLRKNYLPPPSQAKIIEPNLNRTRPGQTDPKPDWTEPYWTEPTRTDPILVIFYGLDPEPFLGMNCTCIWPVWYGTSRTEWLRKSWVQGCWAEDMEEVLTAKGQLKVIKATIKELEEGSYSCDKEIARLELSMVKVEAKIRGEWRRCESLTQSCTVVGIQGWAREVLGSSGPTSWG